MRRHRLLSALLALAAVTLLGACSSSEKIQPQALPAVSGGLNPTRAWTLRLAVCAVMLGQALA